MTTTADELRTAAEALRTLAAAATQLPWRKHDAAYPHLVIQAPADVPASECAGMISTNLTPNEDADAAYIAAMGPNVGTLLADWLEFHAAMNERLLALVDGLPDGDGHPALALARAINGDPSAP